MGSNMGTIKSKIGNRFVFLLFVPVFGIIALGIIYAGRQYTQKIDIEGLQAYIRIAETANGVLHELQRERGLAVAYLDHKKQQSSSVLEQQYIINDAGLGSMQVLVDSVRKDLLPESFWLEYINIVESLRKLPELRARTVSRNIDSAVLVTFYNEVNSHLIKSLEEIVLRVDRVSSPGSDISALGRIYINLLYASEYAGIERMNLTSILSKGVLSRDFVPGLVENRAKQASLIGTAENFAPKDYKARLVELQAELIRLDPDKIYLQIVTSDDPAALNLDPAEWFKVASQRIQALNSVAAGVLKQIDTASSKMAKGVQAELAVAFFFLLLVFVFTLVSSYLLYLQVHGRVTRLLETLDFIEKTKNFDLRIDDESDDELGEITQSINRMLSELQVQNNHSRYHDPLTQLPNRQFAMEYLDRAVQQAASEGSMVAVVYVDLDNFKLINDSLGFDSGNKLLVEFAGRVRQLGGESRWAARLGVDDFMIIVSGLKGLDRLSAEVSKIKTMLSKPIGFGGNGYHISMCVGVSVYPADGNQAMNLISNAASALNSAKQLGRGQVCYFHQELNVKALDLYVKDTELRLALERSEFSLVFQPQVSTEDGLVVGAEALLRWTNKNLGFVPPDEFIPLAERAGLIVSIGRWTLVQACLKAAAWPVLISISVNVSAVQFTQDDIVEVVKTALSLSNLPPERLTLELTESIMLEDFDKIVADLHAITALGVKIALDDFGTGFSSLSYLCELPFDVIKLDRIFIANIEDKAKGAQLCRAIVNMAKTLNLGVVAEGVENSAQLEMLSGWGVHCIQGYYFSKPLDERKFLEFCAKTSCTAAC